MNQVLALLKDEIKRAKMTVILELVVLAQPTVMYLIMGSILVHPTFQMNLLKSNHPLEEDLISAIKQVGSPIGDPYIDLQLVDHVEMDEVRQVIILQSAADPITAVHQYGLIDSNLVKNYRNRLTAAALILWNQQLAGQGIQVKEVPWLPRDIPYPVYFGMAMIPLAVGLASAMAGGYSIASDFEDQTILLYRIAPTPSWKIIAAKFLRGILTGLLGGSILVAAVGLRNHFWPQPIWPVLLILILVSLIAGGVGMAAGLLTQKTLPTFIIILVSSFAGWLLGSAFGPAGTFGAGYAFLSQFSPNTYAVQLLFPLYFSDSMTSSVKAVLVLGAISFSVTLLVGFLYQITVKRQG